MYIDRVEFIDGGTDQPLSMPSDVLSAEMIASAEVKPTWTVSGLLARVEHVYRITIKPEHVGKLREVVQ